VFSFLKKLDIALFYAVNHFHSPFLNKIVPHFSDVKFIYLFFIFTSLFLLTKCSPRRSVFICFFLILGFLWVDFSVARILKPFFHRERPYVSIPEVYHLENEKFKLLKKPLHKRVSFSFPSSHASNVAYASAYLSLNLPALSFIWIFFAFMVGWSRVYLGVHYPLDVFAGWIYGGIWAFIFYKFQKNVWKKFFS
jgi:undecaprenyl-diphosphatase